MTYKSLLRFALVLWSTLLMAGAHAQGGAGSSGDYLLGAGDVIRIQVFQNPELTTEARVSESGVISFPLAGVVKVAGMAPTAVEQLIARRLREGGFLQNPQVTLNVLQFRSQQVSVLGNVRTPGRYPLETTGMRLSEVLAQAGGVTVEGADQVILMSSRNGRMQRYEIDLVEMFASGNLENDMTLVAGDVIYVNRAAQYYVYGQVQRPGMYAVDRGLTVAQAIAKGGGLTLRGTDKNVRVHRRYGDRTVQVLEPKLDDPVMPGDLIFVRESLF
ncbi:polysaccharide export protein EpsE [Burkholderiaceae bacterium FT117]|uniref:polysaccharide export protein EpsE n=1 Tax=Zeimonas sediminis TaxID=2944268 RepID=UPI002342D306|nr:polysaccharide export protein EpsE [Zeimonas sediminis]MCM5571733.1 polysaccharide export protein EpsE [Zeimonas sediminis]